MIRSDSVVRLLLALLFTYLVALGGTFNGVLIPGVSLFTLALMVILVLIWQVGRWRAGWRWHHTPLDPVFLLWGVAFGLSLLANPDSARRIAIGLWYVALYVGVWYALHDALANRLLKFDQLVDAFLIAGLIIVTFGYFQLSVADRRPGLPRLVSLIGNPNALGTFMVVLLSLIAGRYFSVKDAIGRVLLLLYAFLAFPVLILTLSRGALLGFLVAAGVFGGLMLQAQGSRQTVFSRLRDWWQVRRRGVRLGIAAVSVISGLLIFGVVVVLAQQTVTDSARDPGLRGAIYGHALTAFTEKPLTGHGLFTFGQQLSRLQSQPPQVPHSHAHNAVLHIAAELGLIGLAALAVTLIAVVVYARRNWLARREKSLFIGAAAAVAGFAMTHQLDTLAMMPIITLTGLLVLVMILVPVEPRPLQAWWRRRGHPVGVVVLWTGILLSGWWSASLYADYNESLRYGVLEEDYRGGAERLQPVIDADPYLALYHHQQAYFYGLAANEGDGEALNRAIAAYERYLELEPQDSVARVNLAALHWQNGEQSAAIDAMQQAREIAPRAWQYLFILGNYAEAAGEDAIALMAYKRLTRNSYNLMYPEWEDTAFRRQFADAVKRDRIAAVVLALDEGTAAGRSEWLWGQSELQDEESTRSVVLYLLLQLADNPAPELQSRLLAQARDLAITPVDDAWVAIAQAEILRANGDEAAAQAEIERARELIAPQFGREDYTGGSNVAHFQFLRYTIARQFLPQVYYPMQEVLPLLRFLD